LATNACLRAALEYTVRLAIACGDESGGAVRSLLGVETLPRHFIGVVFLVAKGVRFRIDELLSDRVLPRPEPLVTDFDRHVYQALAETLADLAWPERAARDFDGPPISVVQRRIAAVESSTIVSKMLTNYLANILQDGFAAARIREAVRNLPDDTEVLLRSNDSAAIAAAVMRRIASSSNEDLIPDALAGFASAVEAFRP
jgi:hypothetical protein